MIAALVGAQVCAGLGAAASATRPAAPLSAARLTRALARLGPALPRPGLWIGLGLGALRAGACQRDAPPLKWDRPRRAAPLAPVRDRLRARLAGLPSGAREVAAAMALGDRLSYRRRKAYADAGVLHLAAQSGLHVGLVAAAAAAAVGGLGPVASLVALAYALVAGARPGALRAVALLALACGVRARGRRTHPQGLLATIGAGFALADPGLVTRLDAQLSFAATFGLVHLGPRLAGAHPGALRRALAPSAAAWLATAPCLAFHLGHLAPAALVANLLALPLGAALVATSAALVLCGPWPGAAAAPLQLHLALVAALDWLASTSARALPAMEFARLPAGPAVAAGLLLWHLGAQESREPAPGEERARHGRVVEAGA